MKPLHSLTFLPGTLLAESSFLRVATLLSATGHLTQTQVLGDCATLDAEVDRLVSSASSPQVWVGHSLGGILAINLAIARPDKCAGIVCIASTARADAPGNRSKRLAQLQRALAAGSCEPISLEMKPVFGLVAGTTLANLLMTQAARVGLCRFAQQTEYALTRPDQRERRDRIACPILAIVGIDDDICPPELSDEIAALGATANNSCCIRVAGAGHLMPMTHPEAVAGHIVDFLAMLPPAHASMFNKPGASS